MPDTHGPREHQPEQGAAPRQPAPNEILRARPQEGEIDDTALTAEIIRRFPKILAELAK